MHDPIDLPMGGVKDLSANAQPPETPRVLTRAEIGKLRRQHITIVKGFVTACEHSYDPNRPPRNNCFWCWQAFFRLSQDLVTLHEELRVPGGVQAVKSKYGEKFVKMFKRFISDELLPDAPVEERKTDGIRQEAERGEEGPSSGGAAS